MAIKEKHVKAYCVLVALTASGLPVGMEIDGPEQSDRRLLGVANTLESIIGFNARPPQSHQ